MRKRVRKKDLLRENEHLKKEIQDLAVFMNNEPAGRIALAKRRALRKGWTS